jgi:hypothetical protein
VSNIGEKCDFAAWQEAQVTLQTTIAHMVPVRPHCKKIPTENNTKVDVFVLRLINNMEIDSFVPLRQSLAFRSFFKV